MVAFYFIQFFSTKFWNRNLHYLDKYPFYKHFDVGNVVIFSYSFFCWYVWKVLILLGFLCNWLLINLLRWIDDEKEMNIHLLFISLSSLFHFRLTVTSRCCPPSSVFGAAWWKGCRRRFPPSGPCRENLLLWYSLERGL